MRWPPGLHGRVRAFRLAVMLANLFLAAVLIAFAILAAVVSHWQAIIALPASAAAFLGALAGAGGGLVAIILGALINAELNRRRDDRLRREEGRALALSLHGEILSVVDSFERHKVALFQIIEDPNPSSGLGTDLVHTHLGCSVAIFSRSCDRLGLLGDPALIADLAQFYSSIPTEDKSESFRSEAVREICQSRIRIAKVAIERAQDLSKKLDAVTKRLVPPA